MPSLSGFTVLDLTRLLPGGFCTLVLADLGATVIKIEEPTRGDYLREFPPMGATQSVLFNALNRGKRSVTLNLKTPAGQALLLELARDADVLVEGFRPGVLNRLGLDPAVLRRANPRLVICSITGYGQHGPHRTRAGHDLNYLGLSGALSFFAPRGGGRPSVTPGVQIADIGGGALCAALGIVAALLHRERTGQAETLDVSMTRSVMHWLHLQAAELLATANVPLGGCGPLSGGYACYSIYRTADSRALTVACVEPVFWATLCARIGRPDLVAAQYSPQPEQARVFDALDRIFGTRTLDEWVQFFGDDDVCVSPILSLREALDGNAERLVEIDQPGEGRLVHLGGLFGSTARLPAPRLGEHTDEILAARGHARGEIDEMRQAGIV